MPVIMLRLPESGDELLMVMVSLTKYNTSCPDLLLTVHNGTVLSCDYSNPNHDYSNPPCDCLNQYWVARDCLWTD